jgi:hypothetical protein
MRPVVVALLLLANLAHADVGVVVMGDPNMQTPVMNAVQRWVQDKRHELVAAPLGESTTAMLDCFVMDDVTCAQKTFSEHSKADTVVFVRIDAQTGERSFVLNAYWFTKGSTPLHEKRPCASCDDTKLWVAVDGVLAALLHKAADGKGTLMINGVGDVDVQVDGKDVGRAPLEQQVTVGSHEVVFVHDGTPIGVTRVEVAEGVIVPVAVPYAAPSSAVRSGGHSRVGPIVLTLTGIAAAAVGGTLLYSGSLDDSDEPHVYTNATEIGLPLALAGAVAIGAGTALWVTAGESGGSVGVGGSF